MSDHSDLVARLRFHANMIQGAEAIRRARPTSDTACFVDPMAKVLHEAADALDVKPGANADLIAEARKMISGTTFFRGTTDNHNHFYPPREGMIARLVDALEVADSALREARAERDAAIAGWNALGAKIAAVRALPRTEFTIDRKSGVMEARTVANGRFILYDELIRALDGDGATKGESI